MNFVFDLKDHEHFAFDLLSIKAWHWIIKEKAESMVLFYDFVSLEL